MCGSWISSSSSATRRACAALSVLRSRSGYAMFCATVMCGNSASDWNTMPKSRRLAGTCVRSRPANVSVPAVGVSRPAMIRISVVLPQPDGPRKQTSLPSGTDRST